MKTLFDFVRSATFFGRKKNALLQELTGTVWQYNSGGKSIHLDFQTDNSCILARRFPGRVQPAPAERLYTFNSPEVTILSATGDIWASGIVRGRRMLLATADGEMRMKRK